DARCMTMTAAAKTCSELVHVNVPFRAQAHFDFPIRKLDEQQGSLHISDASWNIDKAFELFRLSSCLANHRLADCRPCESAAMQIFQIAKRDSQKFHSRW